MEPDHLLCSRNARPRKALVGRAQWKMNQPPSLKRERASLEGGQIRKDEEGAARLVFLAKLGGEVFVDRLAMGDGYEANDMRLAVDGVDDSKTADAILP